MRSFENSEEDVKEFLIKIFIVYSFIIPYLSTYPKQPLQQDEIFSI